MSGCSGLKNCRKIFPPGSTTKQRRPESGSCQWFAGCAAGSPLAPTVSGASNFHVQQTSDAMALKFDAIKPVSPRSAIPPRSILHSGSTGADCRSRRARVTRSHVSSRSSRQSCSCRRALRPRCAVPAASAPWSPASIAACT